MMIQAVLGNPHHPEYGVATIPFPIPRDQHAHCMELLEALEIGDAVKADCKVEKIDSFYTVLKRVEMLTVNVEELNYLAKRLDSFDTGEAAQFQAMAHKLELFELKDLINLTFCCQQATVITDFSDLAAIGRDHYMNLHGGSASVDELNALDGKGTARQLIENGGGTITPYGVVYDNGMKLEQIYDGRFFPCYYYEPNAITVAATAKSEPEDTEHITWLFLPMEREEIDRALLRGGITDPADVRLRLESSQLPDEVDVLLRSDRSGRTLPPARPRSGLPGRSRTGLGRSRLRHRTLDVPGLSDGADRPALPASDGYQHVQLRATRRLGAFHGRARARRFRIHESRRSGLHLPGRMAGNDVQITKRPRSGTSRQNDG